MHTEIRCLKKEVSLRSPDTALIFLPKMAMNSDVAGHMGPKVSMDTGWNRYLVDRSRYLAAFLEAAAVAAAPAWVEEATK